MEDRKTAIAIFLCITLVMVYSEYVFAPYKRVVYRRAPADIASHSTPQGTSEISSPPPVGATGETGLNSRPAAQGHSTPDEIVKGGITIVSTPLTRSEISHLGARFSSLKLKQYRAAINVDAPHDLILSSPKTSLPLGVLFEGTDDERVSYALEAVSGGAVQVGNLVEVASSGDATLTFAGTLPSGNTIKKSLTFHSANYLIDVAVQLGAAAKDGSPLWLEWQIAADLNPEHKRINPQRFTVLDENGKIHHTFATDPKEVLNPIERDQWAAVADKYFMAAILPPAASAAQFGRVGDADIVRVAGGKDKAAFTIYAGPKDFPVLSSAGRELDRSIDLGWFTFLAHPLLIIMRAFYGLLGNWGLSIILLTLLLKLSFLPLTQKSFVAMKAMQELQPEIKALRERVKDPTILNRELAALYQRRGVNPMGGCLPIFLQLPVFLGLYNALNNSIDLRHAPFALWINDLSTPERLYLGGIGFPIMVIMMGASMLIQQWTTPTAADPAQKRAMMIAPVIFTVMFVIYPVPSGLALYMLVNNLISIIQQKFLAGHKQSNPMTATALASVAIFSVGFVLTLL